MLSTPLTTAAQVLCSGRSAPCANPCAMCLLTARLTIIAFLAEMPGVEALTLRLEIEGVAHASPR